MPQDSIKPINTNHSSLNTYTASSDLQSRWSEYWPLSFEATCYIFKGIKIIWCSKVMMKSH